MEILITFIYFSRKIIIDVLEKWRILKYYMYAFQNFSKKHKFSIKQLESQ